MKEDEFKAVALLAAAMVAGGRNRWENKEGATETLTRAVTFLAWLQGEEIPADDGE